MMAKTIVGAHVVCYINNAPFGQVTSFSFSSATPRKAIETIDSVDPMELAVTRAKVTGSLSLVRTHNDGGLEGAGIAAHFSSLPNEKYFAISLVDRATGLTIFQAQECALTGQSWSGAARGAVTGQLSFEALTWSNEVRSLGFP